MDLEIAKQNILGNTLNPDNQTSIEIPKIINQLDSENIESISLIHNKNHIILAQDIDDNNKSINQIIEKKAVEFNKSRIRKKLKEIRDKRKIEFNDNDYKIPEEEKQKIKQELLSDNETEKFKESQLESVKIQQENYYEIRQIVNGLNDLNEFSSEIERYNIQRIEEFLPYQELFSQSISNIDLYIKMIETRKKELISFVNEFNDKYILEESKKLDETQILSNLHELYKITRDIDDIDLYEKFNLQSNLDFSNKLSDLMFIRALNNNQNNIINDRYNSQNTGILSGLIKKEVINNKLFGNLLRTSNGKNTYFVSTNKVTCMNTMFINNQTNNKVYSTRTLGELLLEITNPDLKGIDKATRQQIYTTYDGTRPDKESYYKWNGLQVYDIDLKEWKLKDGSHGNVNLLKNKLFELLTEFHWFLWICTSASGNGIHIYTKVSPPHHVYLEAEKNEYISAYWYFVNYITKLSIVYDVLNRLNNIPNNHIEFPNEDFEIKFVDNTVGRITSGIRLTHDENVLVNPNFLDLHPAVMLSQTFDGFNVQEEINKIFLRDSKTNNKFIGKINDDLIVGKLEEFEKKKFEKDTPIDLTKFISLGGDISNIIPLNRNQINYVTRYNVCNTLAAMFGKEGLPIAHRLLDSENCRNVGEINSFYSCALTNKKTATKVGIEILKKYGIIKTVEIEVKEVLDDKYKAYIKKQIEKALDNHMEDYTFKLNKNQYLGDIKENIFNMLKNDKINMLFSPPGSGKCFGKDTEILMYDGSIKKVQDIVVGDIVMGWDSKPRTVLNLARGNEEMFEIKPKHGKSWTCNKSHILSLHTKKAFVPDIMNIELKEFLKLKKYRQKHWGLFHKGIEYEYKDIDIDPYFLGYWLGDGTTNDCEFTINSEDSKIILPILENYINKFDCEFGYYEYDYMSCPRYRVKSKNYDRSLNNRNYLINENPIYTKFKKYNLIGNKHIPKEFLHNSRNIRLELFAGLIDSDGTRANNSYVIGVSKKYGEQFKNDIIFLCRSLGYFVSERESYVIENNKKYEKWIITISGNFKDVPIKYDRKIIIYSNKKTYTEIIDFDIIPLGIGDYYGFTLDGKDKMFLLGDFTVVHNTELIKNIALDGKKVLLVLPYISVIKNKIEGDKKLMEIFECYYGTKDIKQIDYGINVVTTFDKFSKANYEKLSKIYDYIILDEGHLLFTSSYRIETTSNAVKKLKELFYISSNDPFAAKLILMTGTETGESYFFGKVANIIRVSKPSLLKEMEFLICNDQLDAVTRLASKADTLLREGYKLLIPTNKGDIYSEKLIGMIQYLYDGKIKYGYYKRSNTEQEICRLINDKNTTGDYNIIFCSNYLSVGVDINDKDQKFASLYLGNFSGYEIEQFNARIRKTGIKSIYCVTTNNSDGTTNDVLLEEPSLVLRITDDEKLFFLDDKEIANAKTEFLVTYDPVLRRIITPGFSLLNGKFAFNLEEYELVSFENKYSECMQHPIKVARELAKYGYKITVSTEFEGLGLSMQEELKKIGIASAKEEKIRKHNILVGTFLELIDNNTYKNQHGLEFSDVIEFIMKHTDMIQEERDLVDANGIPCNIKIDFDIFSTPTAIFVRSKEALEKMIGYARYLIKRYSKTKAKELLLRYVTEEGILEQKKFKRAINLLKLVEASDANELSEPITRTLEKIYEFVDKFDISKDYRVTFDSYRSFLELLTNDYIAMLGIKINTKHAFDKIQDSIVEMIQDVATKSTSSKGIRFIYNRLSDQDSERVINRRSVDTIVQNMFKLTSDLILEKNRIRKKHIILQKQEF